MMSSICQHSLKRTAISNLSTSTSMSRRIGTTTDQLECHKPNARTCRVLSTLQTSICCGFGTYLCSSLFILLTIGQPTGSSSSSSSTSTGVPMNSGMVRRVPIGGPASGEATMKASTRLISRPPSSTGDAKVSLFLMFTLTASSHAYGFPRYKGDNALLAGISTTDECCNRDVLQSTIRSDINSR